MYLHPRVSKKIAEESTLPIPEPQLKLEAFNMSETSL